MSAPDDLLTVAEAARLLRTSKPRVRRMLERGELPGVAVTAWRLRRADVLALAPLGPGSPGRPRVRSVEHSQDRAETP